jgi:uncharacterized protein with ATP-grasp and redox domains
LTEQVAKAKDEVEKITKERDGLLQTVSTLHKKLQQTDNSTDLTNKSTQNVHQFIFKASEADEEPDDDEEERASKNREAYLNVMVRGKKEKKLCFVAKFILYSC